MHPTDAADENNRSAERRPALADSTFPFGRLSAGPEDGSPGATSAVSSRNRSDSWPVMPPGRASGRGGEDKRQLLRASCLSRRRWDDIVRLVMPKPAAETDMSLQRSLAPRSRWRLVGASSAACAYMLLTCLTIAAGMSSTGPRTNGKSPPFRVNRMRPARDQNQNQNQASGSIDARMTGSSSVNNNSYAYTNVLPSSPPGRSNGRAQSPTNSGDRYDYYRDYRPQKQSPTSDYGDDGNGGGRNGGNRSNAGSGSDRDRDGRNASNDGNTRPFQHHVSFSFNLGPTGDYYTDNRNANGGGLAGMPVQMPLFGSGFPFGGGGGGQRGFGSFSPFRPF
ncbi:hypothetical protein CMQ_2197 [Grosmannia clavigera kw1407]|uniref:Uncharacterized protein n=1 Tax=Grosmannia clavigera (strain kw1407 / UAMH 11150) TaxID=655863 RepID=F0XIQ0_GROCL|nr:uncharacterized protein CMQ_2197 [Grosmannia clavigera kw1407]EFX02148.1 hypothetical protein CMQ_2197 [Grosmannia clavigera kw1407]